MENISSAISHSANTSSHRETVDITLERFNELSIREQHFYHIKRVLQEKERIIEQLEEELSIYKKEKNGV